MLNSTVSHARTNEEWLRDLRAHGEPQARALEDLRAMLKRAALFTFSRTRNELAHLGRDEIRELADESAQEALVALLKHLDEFRGASKFTTWAYKFAVNFALPAARREGWKRVSLEPMLTDSELPELTLPDQASDSLPDQVALQRELWETIREIVEKDLTPRQRQAIKAILFDEVPMDELVRHWGTNRNAIYKLLHDARVKLKARLEQRGITANEAFEIFRERD